MMLARLLLALAALCWLPAASADDWRVDLLIFEDLSFPASAGNEQPAPLEPLQAPDAVAVDDAPRLAALGIRILPEGDFGLAAEWRRLENARRFRPRFALSFIQRDPPQTQPHRILLKLGDATEVVLPMAEAQDGTGERDEAAAEWQPESWSLSPPSTTVHELEGTVGLTLGRYLHVHADLAWLDLRDPARPGQWRLNERRRMRSGELHHLDNPRFGMLVRIIPMRRDTPDSGADQGS